MNLKGRAWQIGRTWLLTVVLVTLGFAAYSYFYVEGHRRYFNQKRLRNLHSIAINLKSRVENIANNVIPNAIDESGCGTTREWTDIAAKAASSSVADSQAAGCSMDPLHQLTDLVSGLSFEKNAAVDGRLTPGFQRYAINLAVDQQNNGPVLVLTLEQQTGSPAGPSSAKPLRATLPLKELLGDYDTESFDEVVVTDEKGVIFFRKEPGQIQVTNLAALLTGSSATNAPASKPNSPAETADWANLSAASSVWTSEIGGEPHVIFIEPVQISLSQGRKQNEYGSSVLSSWRVAGIVEKSRITRESYSVSYTIVLAFLFLFLLVIVAWPFLKVFTLGPHDRLARYDVILLCIAAVLTTALFSFFLTDVYAYLNLEQRLDLQLSRLAGDIKCRFDADVQSLLRTVRGFSEMPGVEDMHVTAAKGKIPSIIEAPQDDPYEKKLKKALRQGTFFQRAVWIDAEGQQQYKRTLGKPSPPLIQVGERQYFQKIHDREGWVLKSEPLTSNSAKPVEIAQFWIEPLISWTTGESIATLSAPIPADKAPRLGAKGKDGPVGDAPWVLAIDMDLPSLRNVILPPGYGFAVIDNNGVVQFHSDSPRHWQEDFLVECDNDAEVRAAVFGAAAEPISGRYLGTDHRFYVTRLASAGGPPWALVVFRDKLLLRTANVEALSVALIMYGWLFVGMVPLFLIFWARRTDWLWPKREHSNRYPVLLYTFSAMVILFLIAIFDFRREALAYAAIVIPAAVLLLTRACLGAKPVESRWALGVALGCALLALFWLLGAAPKVWVWLQTLVVMCVLAGICFLCLRGMPSARQKKGIWRGHWRRAYRLLIVALLVLIGVLPALGFFRIAYENELSLYVKHGQFRLAQSLEQRRERLASRYKNISGGDELHKLWNTQARDVYLNFFFPCEQQANAECSNAVLEDACKQNPSSSSSEVDAESMLDRALRFSRPLYNKAAIEDHEFAHNQTADDSYWWSGKATGCVVLHRECETVHMSPAALQPPPVAPPVWWKSVSTGLGLIILFSLGVLSLVVWGITAVIARDIFLLHLRIRSVPLTARSRSFDSLWLGLSQDEKLALYDLAVDGFVNRNNPAIQSLLKQGLIDYSPLRIYSRRFCEFVKRKGVEENIAASSAGQAPSAWRTLKWPLVIVVAATASFLFFSQRHVFDTSIGFIGALVTGLTGVYKLLDVVRGQGRQP